MSLNLWDRSRPDFKAWSSLSTKERAGISKLGSQEYIDAVEMLQAASPLQSMNLVVNWIASLTGTSTERIVGSLLELTTCVALESPSPQNPNSGDRSQPPTQPNGSPT